MNAARDWRWGWRSWGWAWVAYMKKPPQAIIWTSSSVYTACISVCLRSGTRHWATNTWFQYSLLQLYRFWSNPKLVWLTLWYNDVIKEGNSFISYKCQNRGKKRQSPYSKFICLKFSIFKVDNINVNLNAVGSYPKSIFRFLDMLLQFTYWQLC